MFKKLKRIGAKRQPVTISVDVLSVSFERADAKLLGSEISVTFEKRNRSTISTESTIIKESNDGSLSANLSGVITFSSTLFKEASGRCQEKTAELHVVVKQKDGTKFQLGNLVLALHEHPEASSSQLRIPITTKGVQVGAYVNAVLTVGEYSGTEAGFDDDCSMASFDSFMNESFSGKRVPKMAESISSQDDYRSLYQDSLMEMEMMKEEIQNLQKMLAMKESKKAQQSEVEELYEGLLSNLTKQLEDANAKTNAAEAMYEECNKAFKLTEKEYEDRISTAQRQCAHAEQMSLELTSKHSEQAVELEQAAATITSLEAKYDSFQASSNTNMEKIQADLASALASVASSQHAQHGAQQSTQDEEYGQVKLLREVWSLREKAASLEAEVEAKQVEALNLTSALEQQRVIVSQIEQRLVRQQTDAQEGRILKERVEIYEADIKLLQTKLDDTGKALAAAEKVCKNQKAEMAQDHELFDAELSRITKRNAALEDQASMKAQEIERVTSHLQEYRSAKRKLEKQMEAEKIESTKLASSLREKDDKATECLAQIASLEERMRNDSKDRLRVEDEQKAAEAQIEKLGAENKALHENLTHVNATLKNAEELKTTLENDLLEMRRARDKIENQLKSLQDINSSDAQGLEDARKRQHQLQTEYDAAIVDLEAGKHRENNLQRDIAALQKALNSAQKVEQNLRVSMSDLQDWKGQLEKDVQATKANVSDMAATLREKETAITLMNDRLQKSETSTQSLRSDLEESDALVAELRLEITSTLAQLKVQGDAISQWKAEYTTLKEDSSRKISDLQAVNKNLDKDLTMAKESVLSSSQGQVEKNALIDGLQGKLAKCEGDLSATSTQLAKANIQIQELTSSLQEASDGMAHLDQEVTVAQTRLKKSEQESASLKALCDELNSMKKSLESDLDAIKDSLSLSIVQSKQKDETIKRGKAECAVLSESLSSAEAHLTALKTMKSDLEVDKERATHRISELEACISKAEARSAGAATELEMLKMQLDDMQAAKQALEADLSKAVLGHTSTSQTLQEQESKLGDMIQKLGQSEESVGATKRELATSVARAGELAAELEGALTRLVALDEESATLKKKRLVSIDENQLLETKISELSAAQKSTEKDLFTARQHASEMQERLENDTQKIDSLKQLVGDLEGRLQQETIQREKVCRNAEILTTERDGHAARIVGLESECATVTKTLAQCRAEANELSERVDELQASRKDFETKLQTSQGELMEATQMLSAKASKILELESSLSNASDLGKGLRQELTTAIGEKAQLQDIVDKMLSSEAGFKEEFATMKSKITEMTRLNRHITTAKDQLESEKEIYESRLKLMANDSASTCEALKKSESKSQELDHMLSDMKKSLSVAQDELSLSRASIQEHEEKDERTEAVIEELNMEIVFMRSEQTSGEQVLQARIDELSSSNKSLASNLSATQSALKDSNLDLKNAQSKVQRTVNELRIAQECIQALQADKKGLVSKADELSAASSSLQTRLDESNKELEASECVIQKLRSTEDAVQEELQRLRDAYELTAKSLLEKDSDLIDLRHKVAAAEDFLIDTEDQLAATRHELEISRKRHAETDAEYVASKAKLVTAHKDADQVREQVNELRACRRDLESEVAQLTADLANARKVANTRESDMHDLDTSMSGLQAEFVALQAVCEHKEALIQTLNEEATQRDTRLKSLEDEKITMSVKLESFELQMEQHLKQIEDLRSVKRNLELKVASIADNCTGVTDVLEKKESHLTEVVCKLCETEDILEDTRKQFTSSQERASELSTLLDQFTADHATQVRSLKSEIHTLTAACKALEDDKKSLSQNVDALSRRTRSAEAKSGGLEADVAFEKANVNRLTGTVEELNAISDESLAQIDRMTQEMEILREKYTEVECKLHEHLIDSTSSKRAIADTTVESTKLSRDLILLQAQYDLLKRESTDVSALNTALRSDMSVMERDNKDLEKAKNDLQQKIANMKAESERLRTRNNALLVQVKLGATSDLRADPLECVPSMSVSDASALASDLVSGRSNGANTPPGEDHQNGDQSKLKRLHIWDPNSMDVQKKIILTLTEQLNVQDEEFDVLRGQIAVLSEQIAVVTEEKAVIQSQLATMSEVMVSKFESANKMVTHVIEGLPSK